MKKHRIHIGTSGCQYRHWRGTFYPADLRQSGEFGYYLEHFDTVEINNSFYKLPEEKTFAKWQQEAPRGFVYSVKASRFITHMKKLKDPSAIISQFMERVTGLNKKLGPILFQLPPHWKRNASRLEEFLAVLPGGFRYVFEFRNQDWYDEEVYTLLRKYGCAFCIYELAGHMSPLMVTADFVYIRLHGPGEKYQGNYSGAALKKWHRRCTEWLKTKDVYLYFDNDQAGYAAFNAIYLSAMFRQE